MVKIDWALCVFVYLFVVCIVVYNFVRHMNETTILSIKENYNCVLGIVL